MTKKVNANLTKRMESDCWNYVTVPGPDIGSLLSVSVRRDDSGNAPDWLVDEVTVESHHYHAKGKAHFNRWIDSTQSVTAPVT